MSDMLREMDHGPSALPAGSQLTLFNSSTNVEIMARVKARNRCALNICPLSGYTNGATLPVNLIVYAKQARCHAPDNTFFRDLVCVRSTFLNISQRILLLQAEECGSAVDIWESFGL